MLKITPIGESKVTRIKCPRCREKLPRIGLLEGSKIDGLSFTCKKCGERWKVSTE